MSEVQDMTAAQLRAYINSVPEDEPINCLITFENEENTEEVADIERS